MCRVHITGNAGSGKSTLAARIAGSLDVPVFGLDSVVWEPGWRKTPLEKLQNKVDELVARPSWVIEGVSKKVRNAADVVIFLDVSRRLCFLRCAKRNWRYLFHGRPELPARCPEILIIPRLIKLIWAFPERVRPRIIDDMANSDRRSYVVRSQSDLRAALDGLDIR